MVVCELMKTSWCPIPNADSILRATQVVQKELNSDCNLQDLNFNYNLMTTLWSCLAGDQKTGLSLVAVWRKSVN